MMTRAGRWPAHEATNEVERTSRHEHSCQTVDGVVPFWATKLVEQGLRLALDELDPQLRMAALKQQFRIALARQGARRLRMQVVGS
jgi:uncharacterized membrane protein